MIPTFKRSSKAPLEVLSTVFFFLSPNLIYPTLTLTNCSAPALQFRSLELSDLHDAPGPSRFRVWKLSENPRAITLLHSYIQTERKHMMINSDGILLKVL